MNVYCPVKVIVMAANLLKKNTDYALRVMVNLAGHYADGMAVSASRLGEEEQFSTQFASKILQVLCRSGLVESVMGAKGGYRLSRNPDETSLLDVVTAVQGSVNFNDCSPAVASCPRKGSCPIGAVLVKLERTFKDELGSVSIGDLLSGHGNGKMS